MRLFLRLCSALLCLFLFSIAFSLSSYAAAIPEQFTDDYEPFTNIDGSIYNPYEVMPNSLIDGITWTVRSTYQTGDPSNTFSYSNRLMNVGTGESPLNFTNGAYVPYGFSSSYINVSFMSSSGLNIPEGSHTVIAINNINLRVEVADDYGTPIYSGALGANKIKCTHLRILYNDNTTEILYNVGGLTNAGENISFVYTIDENPKVIKQLMFCFWWDNGSVTGLDDYVTNGTFNSDWSVYVSVGCNNSNATISWEEGERSLLSSIKDGITNLPEKIWEKISTGLKELFIPSEEDLTAIKDNFDTMLSERFGALYEVGGIISDFAESFEFTELKDTIELPVISLDFGEASWEFGGYTVDVVPDNFQFLVDMLKTLISICCIALFINAMKHKYDKLVGGAHV